MLPSRIRVDRGTETGVMCTIHSYLRAQHGDVENGDDSVLYGASTENKIERWWRELSHRMEGYFKDQLKSLLEDGYYDTSDENDRFPDRNTFGLLVNTAVHEILQFNAHKIQLSPAKFKFA